MPRFGICEVVLGVGEEIVVCQQFVSVGSEIVEFLLEGGEEVEDKVCRGLGGRHCDDNVFGGGCWFEEG